MTGALVSFCTGVGGSGLTGVGIGSSGPQELKHMTHITRANAIASVPRYFVLPDVDLLRQNIVFRLFWIAVLRYDFRTDEGRRILWRRLIPLRACLKAAAAMICLGIPTQRSTPYFLFPALAPHFSAAVLFGSPGCERRQALPPGTAVPDIMRTGPVRFSTDKYRNFFCNSADGMIIYIYH